MIRIFLGKLTAQSMMRILLKNSTKGKGNLEGASEWPLNDWISILAKGGGVAKKRFQYCLNPNSSNAFCASEQSSDILEVLPSILNSSPSTSTTSGMSMKCIQ